MLHLTIKTLLTKAMKERDVLTLGVLRSLLTGITRALGEMGKKPNDTLDDKGVIQVVKTLIKQRKEAEEAFANAGREEQSEQEKKEGAVLTQFLPTQLTEQEIQSLIEKEIKQQGNTVNKGKLIGSVMRATEGSADGSLVRSLIEKMGH